MQIKLTGVFPEIDIAKFEADLQIKLINIVREGAGAFAVATAKAVPVQTGMARASIQPLGRITNKVIPIATSSDQRQVVRGRKQGKTIAAGNQQGRAELISGGARASIIFTTRVLHYFINELHGLKTAGGLRPRPWKTFNEGKAAFRKTVRAIAPAELKTLRLITRKTTLR